MEIINTGILYGYLDIVIMSICKMGDLGQLQ